MNCEKRTRKRYFPDRKNETDTDTILCDQCKREWINKNYARIYPSRGRIQHGNALGGVEEVDR